jgi:hypothetical protein
MRTPARPAEPSAAAHQEEAGSAGDYAQPAAAHQEEGDVPGPAEATAAIDREDGRLPGQPQPAAARDEGRPAGHAHPTAADNAVGWAASGVITLRHSRTKNSSKLV